MHTFTTEKEGWYVSTLIKAASQLKAEEISIDSIDLDGETKRYLEADLAYPIIISEKGYIMDGHHRLAKALMLGMKKIKAIRFEHDPKTDFIPKEVE